MGHPPLIDNVGGMFASPPTAVELARRGKLETGQQAHIDRLILQVGFGPQSRIHLGKEF